MDVTEAAPEYSSGQSRPLGHSNLGEKEDDNSSSQRTTTATVKKRTKTGCLSASSFLSIFDFAYFILSIIGRF